MLNSNCTVILTVHFFVFVGFKILFKLSYMYAAYNIGELL